MHIIWTAVSWGLAVGGFFAGIALFILAAFLVGLFAVYAYFNFLP